MDPFASPPRPTHDTLPPPTAGASGSPTPDTSRRPTWKRKRVVIPAGVVVALLAIGVANPTPSESDAASAPAKSDTTVAAEPAPTTEVTAPPATDAAPETSAPVETSPATSAPPITEPAPVAPAAASLVGDPATVTHVVDGDTIDISSGERIRILGYDTPERGVCGYDESTAALAFVLLGGPITVLADDGDDVDPYGRSLRHVLVDGKPVGLTMIETGNADARYDSLDGYPRHRYQDEYRAADGPNTFACATVARSVPASAPAVVTPPAVAPAPPAAPAAPPAAPPANNGPFANCDAVRAAGRAPILRGEPGFQQKFDRDNDGVGCEN